MTPIEFRLARLALGKTRTQMAKAIGQSFRNVTRMEKGERPVSDTVALLVERLAAAGIHANTS